MSQYRAYFVPGATDPTGRSILLELDLIGQDDWKKHGYYNEKILSENLATTTPTIKVRCPCTGCDGQTCHSTYQIVGCRVSVTHKIVIDESKIGTYKDANGDLATLRGAYGHEILHVRNHNYLLRRFLATKLDANLGEAADRLAEQHLDYPETPAPKYTERIPTVCKEIEECEAEQERIEEIVNKLVLKTIIGRDPRGHNFPFIDRKPKDNLGHPEMVIDGKVPPALNSNVVPVPAAPNAEIIE